MIEKPAKPKKQKLLYLITKGNWGGAQRYVFDLATNISKEFSGQFDVTVAIGEGEILEKKLVELGIRVIKVESLQRDINMFSDLRVLVALVKLFRRERPDVLHLNSSKAGILGALAARIAGVPRIIFTGHGWAWNENRFFISKIFIGFVHWLTIMLCHKTIAVAEQIKRQVDSLPFVSNKTLVIHNGIGSIKFKERDEARRELGEFGFDINEKLWIGTISELHKNKGLDYLISAFGSAFGNATSSTKNNQSIALIIIGNGEEKERLTELAKKLDIIDRVYFIGFVADASTYLKAFDIFTLTSRTEAFPYTILEAGLAQVPIIASRVGGIPEAINDKETGILVERGNVVELSKALMDLTDDSAKAALLGQAMRKRAEQIFSLSTMIEKTVGVYNS